MDILHAFGYWTAHDVAGQRCSSKYGRQRIAAGATAFASSLGANNGRIFCLSENGDTFLIQAGPEFKVIGSSKLGEMCMATPAVVRGSLIIRTISKLYRIQE